MEGRFHNVAVVGLGLIGGSLALAVKARTGSVVCGFDTDAQTMEKAVRAGAVDRAGDGLDACGTVFLALYPGAAARFVRENIAQFCVDSLIVDLCGIKRYLCAELGPLCDSAGLHFVGAHPMAGREQSGFDYAHADLFQGASVILTPEGQPEELLFSLEGFLRKAAGFAHLVRATPEHHDRMIAYTSQLAHVLSSAYIQNPLARDFCGFTGGSFQDLTRVSRLNSEMWSELFLRNRDMLAEQVDVLIGNLQEYKQMLVNEDCAGLAALMDAGTAIKNELLSRSPLE